MSTAVDPGTAQGDAPTPAKAGSPTRRYVLLEEVQYLFHNVEQVNLVLGRLAAGEDRIFRLGAPPSIGHSIVPGVLRDLRRQFKTLAIHFDILPMEQVIWLVVGLALLRDRPIQEVVDKLELALPSPRGAIAKSANGTPGG